MLIDQIVHAPLESIITRDGAPLQRNKTTTTAAAALTSEKR